MLADGNFHSGAALGAALGVSRSAVWKLMTSLRQLGLEVQSVPSRGYRLPAPLELLDAQQIRSWMAPTARAFLSGLETHLILDSTNRHLMRQAGNGLYSGYGCLAELQTAGRGRRGRRWVSPLGGGIYLSLLWRFEGDPSALGGLSLLAGVAVARALQEIGVEGLGLKWPNDIVWRGRKLGGILIEIGGQAGGPCHAVIGTGINVRLNAVSALSIDQPWVDIASVKGGALSRNALAGTMLSQLINALRRFEIVGLAPFLLDWAQWDVLSGNDVVVRFPDREVRGVARGVDRDGALMVYSAAGLERYTHGDVSVRMPS